MPPGRHLHIGGGPGKERSVYTADFREVGTINWPPITAGIFIAKVAAESQSLIVEYIGPGDAGTW